MAKYVHADFLDGGLNAIKNGATRMILIKAYSAADSYSTVLSNAVATVVMTSSDFAISGSDGASRVLTVSAKTGSATSGSGASPNLHVALTNGTDKVLWVSDEVSDQVITAGNNVNFPSFTYSANQPS